MKVLLTGAAGQLGQALHHQLPVGIELIATSISSHMRPFNPNIVFIN